MPCQNEPAIATDAGLIWNHACRAPGTAAGSGANAMSSVPETTASVGINAVCGFAFCGTATPTYGAQP